MRGTKTGMRAGVTTGAAGAAGTAGLRDGVWLRFAFGAAEAVLVPLAFAALGLCWWGAAVRASATPPAYVAGMAEADELWLVDGFNVVQVALLAGRDRRQWWTAPVRAELMRRVRAFEPGDPADPGVGGGASESGPPRIWVAFDGDRGADEGEETIRAVFVPSADDWLVARVREAADPSRVHVVTADRRLAGRVRHHGGRVVSPAAFLGRCGGRDEEAVADRGENTTAL